MSTAEITSIDGVQTVKLPTDVRINAERVTVRRDGEAVVLEPIKADSWPINFFDSIRIEDPAFVRPEQGQMPPAPKLD
jgi:virulence-associated protein VagC